MKPLSGRLPLAAALLFIVLAVIGPARAQSDLNSSVGIMDLNDAAPMFALAVKQNDMQKLRSFYDEEAVLLSPDGTAIQGRDNIIQLYMNNQRAGANEMVFHQASYEAGENRAGMIWIWDLNITPRGQRTQTITGRSLTYWARTPFGWKIVLDMFQILPVRQQNAEPEQE